MPREKNSLRATSVKPAAKAPKTGTAGRASAETGRSAELSEFEFGLIIAVNAFNRWAVRCMSAAGMKDMTITDVLVLHHINHRAREKKLADIAFILNIEDTHIVNYSLKKLHSLGLVQSERRGKEVLYSTNEAGEAVCKRYFEIREEVLVSTLSQGGKETVELTELARFMRILSGLYDQAARSATSM
ncbi:MAG: transcriptional regulator [Noviherbaspirillum sp.]|nr:transcriptional regulator [Noviherbaspirillum sp.]